MCVCVSVSECVCVCVCTNISVRCFVPDTHTSQMLGHIPVFPGGGCGQQQLRHAAAQAASSSSLAPKMKMDGDGGLQHFNSAAACMPQVGGIGFGLGRV